MELKDINGKVIYKSEKKTVKECVLEANLSGANLSGADLCDANLCSANLSDADFSGANLSDANLSGAKILKVQSAQLCQSIGLEVRE